MQNLQFEVSQCLSIVSEFLRYNPQSQYQLMKLQLQALLSRIESDQSAYTLLIELKKSVQHQISQITRIQNLERKRPIDKQLQQMFEHILNVIEKEQNLLSIKVELSTNNTANTVVDHVISRRLDNATSDLRQQMLDLQQEQKEQLLKISQLQAQNVVLQTQNKQYLGQTNPITIMRLEDFDVKFSKLQANQQVQNDKIQHLEQENKYLSNLVHEYFAKTEQLSLELLELRRSCLQQHDIVPIMQRKSQYVPCEPTRSPQHKKLEMEKPVKDSSFKSDSYFEPAPQLSLKEQSPQNTVERNSVVEKLRPKEVIRLTQSKVKGQQRSTSINQSRFAPASLEVVK